MRGNIGTAQDGEEGEHWLMVSELWNQSSRLLHPNSEHWQPGIFLAPRPEKGRFVFGQTEQAFPTDTWECPREKGRSQSDISLQ